MKFPRFTCAPETRMPRITFPIFKGNVKAIAYAMSRYGAYAGYKDCECDVKPGHHPQGKGN
ncbi:hypothetical protein GCM10010259_64240 [Streptomyces daghestanicus]|uniref:Uncharacterized protein n=1 Tax=Streptomyces griseoviridis TaxID=45398 RepID=A0A918GUU7_STRGD|nr:hypothetical protein GCM10010238_63010 [Streptomyces niveoruber]GGU64989.1 hypothetical protein GCM10010259_64240 [Streptomyces daghestanicus]